MSSNYSNIVLIGMPGSGKSTTGVILAKRLSKGFVDTDVLIQSMEGKSLQELIDKEGYLALRKSEEKTLLKLNVKNHVISTGGSAVYSADAMRHLKNDGLIVFLDVSLKSLLERINNFDTRGIARKPDQSFEDLFNERFLLYSQFADITIDCNKMNTEQACEAIASTV